MTLANDVDVTPESVLKSVNDMKDQMSMAQATCSEALNLAARSRAMLSIALDGLDAVVKNRKRWTAEKMVDEIIETLAMIDRMMRADLAVMKNNVVKSQPQQQDSVLSSELDGRKA